MPITVCSDTQTIVGKARGPLASRRTLVLLTTIITWSTFAGAQPLHGYLDRSFGGDGSVVVRFATANFRGASVTRAIGTFQNGKIVLAGETWDVGWGDSQFPGRLSVARLLNDGRPDPTFGNGDGRASYRGSKLESVWVSDLAIYGDGKVLVAGNVFNGNGFLVRLLPDGEPDDSFGSGGVVELSRDRHLEGVDIDRGGKIVVVCNGLLARLNSDGTPDSGFSNERYGGRDKITTGLVNHPRLRLLGSGKILVAGHLISGTGPLVVARWNADGSRDRSFGAEGKVELPGRWYGVVGLEMLDGGEAIVVGHWVVEEHSHERAIGLVRVTATGRVDQRFNQGRPVVWSSARGLPPVKTHAVASGKQHGGIIVVGETGWWDTPQSELFVAKFDRDGRFEGEFDLPQTVARAFWARAVAVRGLDQKVVVAGFSRLEHTETGRLWPHFGALRFMRDPPPPAVRGQRPQR